MSRTKKILRNLGISALAATLIAGTVFKEEIFGGSIETEIMGDKGQMQTISLPIYSYFEMRPFHCAAYANRTARNKFGINIDPASTWELHEKNPSKPFFNGGLNQGNIVTFYHEKSSYNEKGRDATHSALYVGRNEKGIPLFAQQRGWSTEVKNLEEMREMGWIPKRIIYEA